MNKLFLFGALLLPLTAVAAPPLSQLCHGTHGPIACGSELGTGLYLDNTTSSPTYDLHYIKAGTDWLEISCTSVTCTVSSATATTLDIGLILTLDAVTLSDALTLSDGLTIDQSANNILTIAENSEDLELTFTTNQITVASTTGVLDIDFGSIALQSPTVATHLQVIRFCGNGSNDGTATYMGPVLLDDTEADLAFGGAGCDALDNATEGTADAPWHTAFAFKPVAMACVGVCTSTSAANDAYTYQLRDDTADVTGMTCTAPAFGGDATPAQCTVQDSTPATVAAASAVAIKMTGTDDVCADAGDDFECLVYVTF